MTGEVEVFIDPFEDPPGATAEAEPAATLYVRVPAALKHSVDEAAAKDRLSSNAWTMRCIEDCLDMRLPCEINEVWNIAAGLAAPWSSDTKGSDYGDEYKLKTATEALAEIQALVEQFARRTLGTGDISKIGDVYETRFQPYPHDRAWEK
jgi:hypothetical protein